MKLEDVEQIAEKYADENGNIPVNSIHAMCIEIITAILIDLKEG